VRNVTDIDDKIIKRAVERGIGIRALTDEMIGVMHQDIGLLGIEPPTVAPRATQYVPQMLALIKQLETKGLAYQASNGDVNFSVRKFPGYGKLSGKTLDSLRAGERVAVNDGKEDPLDFVLWKSAKADEPEDAKWDGAASGCGYGLGRPGWHIECSAMSCQTLGETFDIHGGGADLQFPHHENEIAQSEGVSGKPLAHFWMHNGMVQIDNEKMSKSLGNFFTIREVLAQYKPEIVRFFLVRAHYRTDLNYSDVHLNDAQSGLNRLYTALSLVPADVGDQSIDWSTGYAAQFKAAMDEDFGTPEAVAVLFDLATELNRSKSPAMSTLLRNLGGCLGLLQAQPEAFLQAGAGLEATEIQAQIDLRTAAKLAKNFAEADRIRQALLQQGIALKDSPVGTTWTVVQ
jgi:cysteinyl-tRNA synthetase